MLTDWLQISYTCYLALTSPPKKIRLSIVISLGIMGRLAQAHHTTHPWYGLTKCATVSRVQNWKYTSSEVARICLLWHHQSCCQGKLSWCLDNLSWCGDNFCHGSISHGVKKIFCKDNIRHGVKNFPCNDTMNFVYDYTLRGVSRQHIVKTP